jgi:Glyoxalase-like domain
VAVRVQVTFDCADPDRLARFWASALGYRIPDPPGGFASWEDWLRDMGIPEDQWNAASAVEDPDGAGPRLYFQRVLEGKTAKNRVHLDLNVGGGRETPIEERRRAIEGVASRLEGEGATRIGPMEQRDEFWIVMRDPEGNEFCLQ